MRGSQFRTGIPPQAALGGDGGGGSVGPRYLGGDGGDGDNNGNIHLQVSLLKFRCHRMLMIEAKYDNLQETARLPGWRCLHQCSAPGWFLQGQLTR